MEYLGLNSSVKVKGECHAPEFQNTILFGLNPICVFKTKFLSSFI